MTAALSVLVLVLVAAVGGWLRRWISDDGLIVLRTVRNLLAGNGPVFNVGERVEANTSTLWQYVIWLGAAVTGAKLEYVAMVLALGFTVAAVGVAGAATARMYRTPTLLFVPFGGLIYLALPPARDFATSGLEWGLSIFWLAVLWLLLVNWVRATGRRHARGDAVTYWLAFWCGLSWLVRPELALYGGLAGILLLLSARNWRVALGILAVALPVPAGYQLFRMGYYGLITPHTAVAKSASDAQWASGWGYVRDLADPYGLFLALAVALGMAGVLMWWASTCQVVTRARPERRPGRLRLRSRTGVVVLVVLAASLHVLYIIRVGGDFMHGRMLLLPLFALMLPLMVIPLVDVAAPALLPALVLGLGATAVVGWAVLVGLRGHPVDWQAYEDGELGIVDEREFWSNATRRDPGDPPRTAEDFLPAKALGNWSEAVDHTLTTDGAVMISVAVSSEPERYAWFTEPRQAAETDLRALDPTMYLINLGMTSMNSPLELRVLDTVGLATPVGARQPRDEDGRVGHDKWLPWEWQIADTDADLNRVPAWYDREGAILARAALRSPEISELLASSREPMSWDRFWANVAYSLGDGRRLEISLDPRDHLDDSVVREIEEYVARTEERVRAGDVDGLPTPPGTAGPRIAW
ncbi:hypothetical protein CGUA_12400 [Corynebacterium guangdongense]|nr:hypothetical protein CGUA_12400 [Corynebacterium guangdongense]